MSKTIKLEDGQVYEILDKLGEGGQGAVFKVKSKSTGKMYALKVYIHDMKKDFIDNLRTNIVKGSPNDSFIWPLGLTEPLNNGRRGYIMELIEKKYSSYVKIMKGKAQFPSKEVQIHALLNLVDAFEALHARGYSYQDLNDGGVQFDCSNGDVIICDNDNVAPYGANFGIQGKFKYMAPEVEIGMFRPDVFSDRFSLAVLMFLLLCHAHPYDGAQRLSGALTADLKKKVYGTHPVFIFDPKDSSNRPDPNIDKNAIKSWPLLPPFIQDLFLKTFTSGMPRVGMKKDELEVSRQSRVSEREWRQALHKWLDTMVECPYCQKSICLEVENNAIKATKCPHVDCKKTVDLKRPIMLVKKDNKLVRTIVLENGKIVPKSSVTKEKSAEDAFVVKVSKKDKTIFGIENKLPYELRFTQSNASPRLVKTGETVLALNGVFVEFDYTFSGEIIYTK